MLLSFLLIAIGLALLVFGANWLVSGSSEIARKYGVSELVIGLTVVGFGTSMPELVVNFAASLKSGGGDLVTGNIIGSNNFNLFVILGLAGLTWPLSVQNSTVWKEIPFSLLTILVLLFVANDRLIFQADANVVSRWDGLLLLGIFVVFLWYLYQSLKKDRSAIAETQVPKGSNWLLLGKVAGGMLLMIYGGKLMVDHAVTLAEHFQVSERIIGLTIMAAGTSLPELATSLVAAARKKADLAVGNIVGSNIFNIVFILSTSALIKPVVYSEDFNRDGALLIGGTLLLFLAMFTGKKGVMDRWEALILLLIFLAYMTHIIYQG